MLRIFFSIAASRKAPSLILHDLSDLIRARFARISFSRRQPWVSAATILVSYAVWIIGFSLLVHAFIAWFVISGGSSTGARFEEIGEAFAANELTIMGLSSLLFVFALRRFNPTSGPQGP